MPYTRVVEKTYDFTVREVACAVESAISGLGGKILSRDEDKVSFDVLLDKKILGKVLGDRTHMQIILSTVDEKINVSVTAYPVDAVGRKLMFGARKGVIATVLHWFFAHLEHHLGLPAENPQ